MLILLSVTITALSDNTERTLASINALIQRQDQILDYLIRRDRNSNGWIRAVQFPRQ